MKHFMFLILLLQGCDNNSLPPVPVINACNKISTPLFDGHGQTPLEQMENQASSIENVYTRVCAKPNTVYLTFDDGPSKHTIQILDILDSFHVKATFFVVGFCAKRNPTIVKEIYRRGHGVGNHSYNHNHITEGNIQEEFGDTNALLNVLKVKSVGYRFPWGSVSDHTLQEYAKEFPKAKFYHWSLNTEDWWWNKHGTSYDILAPIKKYVQGGDIILMHDGGGNRSKTVEALPSIIQYLQQQGYSLEKL